MNTRSFISILFIATMGILISSCVLDFAAQAGYTFFNFNMFLITM